MSCSFTYYWRLRGAIPDPDSLLQAISIHGILIAIGSKVYASTTGCTVRVLVVNSTSCDGEEELHHGDMRACL